MSMECSLRAPLWRYLTQRRWMIIKEDWPNTSRPRNLEREKNTDDDF